MEIATLLLISGSVAVGVVAAVVRTWSLHRRAYSLEDRMAVVEGILQREVKTRAAQERWRKPDKDQELLETMRNQKVQPTRQLNWWEKVAR